MEALKEPIEYPDETSEPAAQAGIFLGRVVTRSFKLGPDVNPNVIDLVTLVQSKQNQNKLISQSLVRGELVIVYQPDPKDRI